MTKNSTATVVLPVISPVVSPVVSLPNPFQSETDLANLQARMLAAQTYNQILALIVDYSHQEMQLAYSQLSPQQQSLIDALCERDSLV